MTRQEVIDRLELAGEEAILLDGLDGAILGLVGSKSAAYSVSKILSILKDDLDIPEEECQEFFDFNIASLEPLGIIFVYD